MAKKLLLIGLVLTVVAFGAAIVAYFALFRVAHIPTGSMANTIVPGERVLYVMSVGEVKRGDIVIFKFPQDPKVNYMQRIVGLPGETIQISGTKVLINGQALQEARTFVELENKKGALREFDSENEGAYHVYYEKRDPAAALEQSFAKFAVEEPFQIPAGHYFILGDCRDNSLDSRYWGTLPRDLIIGKALMIVATEDQSRRDKLYRRLN
jgi:signal peptidase I